MRIDAEWFLPWIMEKALDRPVFRDQRRQALSRARGRVLEIGFGFGTTLSEYPAEQVVDITALEPNPGMQRRARKRLARSPVPVPRGRWGRRRCAARGRLGARPVPHVFSGRARESRGAPRRSAPCADPGAATPSPALRSGTVPGDRGYLGARAY